MIVSERKKKTHQKEYNTSQSIIYIEALIIIDEGLQIVEQRKIPPASTGYLKKLHIRSNR